MACLLIDVFCGPSHSHLLKFVKLLNADNGKQLDTVTFPDKKWPWMARTGALICLNSLPSDLTVYANLVVTSTLNLAELVALRPQLQSIRKVMYFHENQLVYPVQKNETSDFQFGYNEIISSLCADEIFFNSNYNLESFLEAMPSFLGRIPGLTAKSSQVADIVTKIRSKSQVLYLPLDFAGMDASPEYSLPVAEPDVCRILWSHRMEHDKDPETFFTTLLQMKNETERPIKFKLVVLGQGFSELSPEIEKARQELGEVVEFWGFLRERKDYYTWLKRCQIVVSSAKHEFFGLSMLEATYLGCYPVAPEALSYPELLPAECLYRTQVQLRKQLVQLCRSGAQRVRAKRQSLSIDWTKFDWETNLSGKYNQLCFGNQ